ncbi:hypothetical protein SSPS47_34995 [Streptomyces sp. S4.7]|uniref:hypothetical protein n=1 Tax=Streptomyces sp. S4.7 TaxID=2705439 RepID=UPI001396D05A|nr:hypothetical protein [Streptomyces sp. S4.7]QHZ00311.1 hypothetical protein SSPS47_34995 [Streptomyces sp. S4.7]
MGGEQVGAGARGLSLFFADPTTGEGEGHGLLQQDVEEDGVGRPFRMSTGPGCS